MRRTKIVATIGPASDAPATLDALIAGGVDVARLNASHADISELGARLVAVREAAGRAGAHVAVMLDLPGPKMRVGAMAAGTSLEPGHCFELLPGECTGDSHRACMTYAGLVDDLSIGDRIMLDDGRIELRVSGLGDGAVQTDVVVGGALSSHKGVNVPGVHLGIDAITGYDREVLAWGLEVGVDLIAQSFVRSADDVSRLRELMGASPVPIVAKIEKHEAADEIAAIVATADVVMVARGDLGVETSPEEVPVLQRRIIDACRDSGTPVIVATQMLESMTTSPRPTRAEASDVANAIFDRVDAVMLSAETAIGSYPVKSVETMARISAAAEESLSGRGSDRRRTSALTDVTRAVSAAACELADDLGLSAIVTATQSGATALAVARNRPGAPVVAVTPSEVVARRLAVVWGVRSVVAPVAPAEDNTLQSLLAAVRDAGAVAAGEKVAVTAGVARGVPGGTDLILVREVPRA
ncbi:MAG: pyruvate kinase [Actinomycetota bacterium]|nr:pyruvate kinase [Actinomycetota bacterium]